MNSNWSDINFEEKIINIMLMADLRLKCQFLSAAQKLEVYISNLKIDRKGEFLLFLAIEMVIFYLVNSYKYLAGFLLEVDLSEWCYSHIETENICF